MFSRITDRLEVDMGSSLLGTTASNSINFNSDDTEEAETCCSSCANNCGIEIPPLTWQERLGGCLACFILGYIISLGSFFRFKDLLQGNPKAFVLYTTVGNIISLLGSFFLAGPVSQFRKMLHPSRKVATVVYISCMILTLVVALVFDNNNSSTQKKVQGVVLLGLIGAQYVAVAWYTLSYIPFARQIAKRLIGRCVNFYEELD